MQKIIPAIIPKNRAHLVESLARVASCAREVQIDVVDGKFVPFTSWPYGAGESIEDVAKYTQDFVIEVDLMVQDPERVLEHYLGAGVRKVVVHLESTTHLADIAAQVRAHACKLGLSVLNDTPLDTLLSGIEYADYVQLMGIAKIGSQGQPFDERVLVRIEDIKKRFPDLCISIDGSVNSETLPLLKKAGAERFVAGSSILGAHDPKVAFQTLSALV